MDKAWFFGLARAPKGDLAYVFGWFRSHVIRALNVVDRFRRTWHYRNHRNSRPRLVAQGDSWFLYPLPTPTETLGHLSRDFAILNFAGAARRTGTMAKPHQLRRLSKAVTYEQPFAVLISGGGGDLLDLMNARTIRDPRVPPIFSNHVPAYLEPVSLKHGLSTLEANLKAVIETALAAGARHVILVGYDYLRVWPNPGQTVRDSLDLARVPSADHQATCNRLMDQLLEVHERLASSYKEVSFVDARGRTGSLEDWHDETHAHSDGYALLATVVASHLAELSKSSG